MQRAPVLVTFPSTFQTDFNAIHTFAISELARGQIKQSIAILSVRQRSKYLSYSVICFQMSRNVPSQNWLGLTRRINLSSNVTQDIRALVEEWKCGLNQKGSKEIHVSKGLGLWYVRPSASKEELNRNSSEILIRQNKNNLRIIVRLSVWLLYMENAFWYLKQILSEKEGYSKYSTNSLWRGHKNKSHIFGVSQLQPEWTASLSWIPF